jgi:excinuclease ABC subunit C
MITDDIKKLNIPKSPGCYFFLNAKGEVIYIGKAANLASRVSSYWRESANHTPAKEEMVKQAKKIQWIEVDSEIEALLLEANLIKKNRPPFNIVMRDDKRFVYIKISTEEEWPRVFMTRQVEKSGRYFGPFVSTEAVRETLRVLRKIWPYRSCAFLPKKACLYYRIGKCPGMCAVQTEKKEYDKIVKQIILFLEGKKSEVIRGIEKEITIYDLRSKNRDMQSEEQDKLMYKLNSLKYQLLNIKKVLEHANVLSLADKYSADVVELAKILGLAKTPDRIEGYDISNIFGQEAVGSMVVFAAGEPDKKEYRKFKIKIGEGMANDVGMLKEIIDRRFNNDWPQPDLIIVDGGKGQLNAILSVLLKRKLDIPVIAVSKGEGLRSALAPDKIFFPGEKKPLVLPLASPALHVIKRVRDEAHRFAIKYHRELRMRKIMRR